MYVQYYIVPARLPNASRSSLFLVPRFVDLDASLERKFRDGMVFDKAMGCNDIVFENVTNSQTDIVFGHGREVGGAGRMGSVAYLISDATASTHAINYFNHINSLFLSMESIGQCLAGFLHSMESCDVTRRRDLTKSKYDKRFFVQKLLQRKSYAEGALALSVYVASLLDNTNNETASSFDTSFEFLSLALRCWTAQYCVARQQLGDITEMDHAAFSEDIDDEEKMSLSIEFLKRINDGGYESLRDKIEETVSLANSERHRDILGGYAADVEAALSLHVEVTERYISLIRKSSADGSEPAVINCHEFVLFTGHLCVAWAWLRQGLEAHRALTRGEFTDGSSSHDHHKHYYLGKISALDYFVNYELVEMSSKAQLLRKNPQILDFAETEWLWHTREH